jgi:hypothetical protein
MSEENPDKVIFTSTEHIDEKIGVTIYTEKIEFHGINVISKFKDEFDQSKKRVRKACVLKSCQSSRQVQPADEQFDLDLR